LKVLRLIRKDWKEGSRVTRYFKESLSPVLPARIGDLETSIYGVDHASGHSTAMFLLIRGDE
jgi:predicted GNAT superfamily acetyltransferase